MKKMACFGFIVLAAVLSFAQIVADINSEGGIISSTGTILSLPNSTVISVNKNGSVTTGNLGDLQIVLPDFTAGDLQNGGTLGAGGTFVVTAPKQSISYSASLAAGAQWTLTTLANGTHSYALQNAQLISSQGNGAFVLQTVNIGFGLWSGSAAVASVTVNVTLN